MSFSQVLMKFKGTWGLENRTINFDFFFLMNIVVIFSGTERLKDRLLKIDTPFGSDLISSKRIFLSSECKYSF